MSNTHDGDLFVGADQHHVMQDDGGDDDPDDSWDDADEERDGGRRLFVPRPVSVFGCSCDVLLLTLTLGAALLWLGAYLCLDSWLRLVGTALTRCTPAVDGSLPPSCPSNSSGPYLLGFLGCVLLSLLALALLIGRAAQVDRTYAALLPETRVPGTSPAEGAGQGHVWAASEASARLSRYNHGPDVALLALFASMVVCCAFAVRCLQALSAVFGIGFNACWGVVGGYLDPSCVVGKRVDGSYGHALLCCVLLSLLLLGMVVVRAVQLGRRPRARRPDLGAASGPEMPAYPPGRRL